LISIRSLPAILVLAGSWPLCAQVQPASGSATVKGMVRDAHQQPIPDVVVTLQSRSHTPDQTARTDVKGIYVFSSVPMGSYSLRAQSLTLGGASYGPLTLADHETKSVDLTLTSPKSSAKTAEFYDEPAFTVAGVSETSGAGVHGSDSAMRNADALTKATASLAHESAKPAPAPASSAADADNAAQQLKKLIASNDQADLHNRLGHIEEESGHSLEALREFQQSAQMDPSENNLFDWGTELLVHRAAEPAAEVFTRGNRLYPRSARMLTGLAVSEYARGRYDQAVERICQASDVDPHDPAPYMFLGRMQSSEVKHSPDALAKLARFRDLYPDNAFANYYYAVALWNQSSSPTGSETTTRVERLLQKSIALDPKMAVAYLQMGILNASREQLPEAASAFEKAIALDTNLEEAHYRLAQTYRRMGNTAEAQRELEAYQRAAQTASEAAMRDRKTVQQFVYELKAPASPPETH
jgi:tetratricopeptide (TPR) repeat protein